MAAVGFPKRKGSDIVALEVPRLRNVPLVGIGAFLSTNTQKDDKTGETYERTQVKLSLDWDSGYPQRDAEGELVTDDEGHGRPHLINDGFVTLSGHNKANFIKILKAIGFQGPKFFDKDGNLHREVEDSLEAKFGKNKLGESADGWADLPEYILRSKGGQHAKREVEVPVTSLKLAGYELIGRVVDLAITVDDSGYNRIESYLRSEDFVDLDTRITPVVSMSLGGPSPRAQAQAGKRAGPSRDEVEVAAVFGDSIDPHNEDTPFDDEPTSKAALYVTRKLKEAGIPGKDRIAFLAELLEDREFASIANIERDAALHFKALVEGPDAQGDSATYLRRQFIEFNSRRARQSDDDLPFDANDDGDGDF